MEHAKVSTSGWMGRDDGVCIYNGKLFSLNKEENAAIGDNME